ncbi:MAG: 4Fe-4S binding protein [Lentisphaeria bacterium]|nr:4Fe-4S binding protein [Lentisphaeria bacterium]
MMVLPAWLLPTLAQITAQARFPKPEFQDYTEPLMDLEPSLFDDGWVRVAILVGLMLLAGLAAHRLKSRRALLALSGLTLIVSGFWLRPCPCPVGLHLNLAAALAGDNALPLTLTLLVVLPLATALLFGRLFCIGGCPLGAIQELVHLKTVRVPMALDRLLRFLPVLILLLSVVAAAAGGAFHLCQLDPFFPIFTFTFAAPALYLGVVLLAIGVFVSRPFCRYLCPYGVLLRFLTLFSVKRLTITHGDCVNCRLCEQTCPNGAILAPEPPNWPEKHARGRERVKRLLTMTPLALAAGAWLGFALAPLLATTNPDVALVRELDEFSDSEAVIAFIVSGRPETELRQAAWQAERTARFGMTGAGAVLALVVMAELIALARRHPERRTYEIDQTLCLVCGRCFALCPVEQARQRRPSRSQPAAAAASNSAPPANT